MHDRTEHNSLQCPQTAFRDARAWEEKAIGKVLIEKPRTIEMKNEQDYSLVTVKRRYGGVVFRGVFKGKSIKVKSQFLLKAKDFLISKRQIVHCACGLVPEYLKGSIVSNEYSILTARKNHDILFFNYFSQQFKVSQSFIECSVGIVIEKMLFKLNDWLKREFLFPPLKEQQKIANCLASIDELITAQSQKIDTLNAHKKGLMQQLFPAQGETVPKLRFPEFRNAGAWELRPLCESLLAHPDYGINAPAVPFSKKLPTYLRITDISEDGYYLRNQTVSVDAKVTTNNYLNKDEIVVARTGASVGKSYKYRKEDGELVFAGFLIRLKPNNQKINPNLLFHFLSTEQYWHWVSITSVRGRQPGINGNEYAALPVPTPSSAEEEQNLSEQQKIADCLSSIDELIAAQSQKIDTLKAHKKGLMQQLFPSIDEVNG